MAEVFRLPKMGQTMTEATILKWLKQEGDQFQGWEAIVEIMTDKINMEVEPQISGTLLQILVADGAVVPLGGPLAIIGSPGEEVAGLASELLGEGSPAAVGAAAPPDHAAAPAAGMPKTLSDPPLPAAAPDGIPSVSPRAREIARAMGVPWKELNLTGTGFDGMVVERDMLAYLEARAASAPSSDQTARVSPLAARIAADLGVPLGAVSGTGPGGRIQADDVRRFRPAAPAPIQAREIPLRGMRRVIAQRLAASYQGAVHVPLRVDVDMAAAGELRRQLKPALEPSGSRITYTDLAAAAVIQALIEQPLLNATLEEEVIRVHPEVNLGVAVALEEGLVVPVVRRAHGLRLPELSRAIRDLAAQARAGSLPSDAYAGGTFTITNLGQFGVDSFDPILNPPQVAILGIGQIRERVVPVAGAPAVRPIATLTLTFDHRALDGAPAARFLALVRELLENPARLLL